MRTTFENTVFWPILCGIAMVLLIGQLMVIGDVRAKMTPGQLDDVHLECLVVFEYHDQSDDQTCADVALSSSTIYYYIPPLWPRIHRLNDLSPPTKPPKA